MIFIAKTSLIKIVPNRGIRIICTEETELMATQLPDWYTSLMNKYEKEMGKGIKV